MEGETKDGAGAAAAAAAAAAAEPHPQPQPKLDPVYEGMAELASMGIWTQLESTPDGRAMLVVLDTPAHRDTVAQNLPLVFVSVAEGADGGRASKEDHARAPVVLKWATAAECRAYRESDMQRHAASVVDRDDAVPSDSEEDDPAAAVVDETDVCPHFSEDVR